MIWNGLSEVRLHFHGAANVHWSEEHSTGSGQNHHIVTRHHTANETYFDFRVQLFGNYILTHIHTVVRALYYLEF